MHDASNVETPIEKPLILEEWGNRSFITACVLVLVSVALITTAFLIPPGKANQSPTFAASAFGILAGIVAFLLFRMTGRKFAWYTNRAEIWKKGQLLHTIDYSDPSVRYTFSFRAGGSGARLTLADRSKYSLVASVGSTPETTLEHVRDLIQQSVEDCIELKLASGESYQVGPRWFITPAGVQINNKTIEWSKLSIHCSNTTGAIAFMSDGKRVAFRSLIEENAIPASSVMMAHAAQGQWD